MRIVDFQTSLWMVLWRPLCGGRVRVLAFFGVPLNGINADLFSVPLALYRD